MALRSCWCGPAIYFTLTKTRPVNTRNSVPFSLQILCGFFNIPQLCANNGCKTGPPAYSPYLRRLESLTICRCNWKGSNFYSEQWSGQSPTRNLMRDSPILSQLSHQCTIQLTYIRITYILYKLAYLSEPFLAVWGFIQPYGPPLGQAMIRSGAMCQ